jgi:hypothetical protein
MFWPMTIKVEINSTPSFINHAILKSVSEANIIGDFLVWISARRFLANDPA